MNLSIGDKIKRLRVEKKMSQEALAKALYFSNRTISNWENNIREVSIINLQKLANYFQVPITYFTEETLTSLPKNGTYQQIKVKKIALSDRYFLFLICPIFCERFISLGSFSKSFKLGRFLNGVLGGIIDFYHR